MNDAARAWFDTSDGDAPTRSHAEAWRQLSAYLLTHWPDICARGSVDLSKAFPGDVAHRSLQVHLYFVNLFARKLLADGVAVDLAPFVAALRDSMPHPEVTLLVADSRAGPRRLKSYDFEVSVLRSGEEVQSALWMHCAPPVAVKICYVKRGAPVREPEGHPWHPSRQRKIVKLSPFKGDTQPLVARRDLRI
jgi:hypothetical protein